MNNFCSCFTLLILLFLSEIFYIIYDIYKHCLFRYFFKIKKYELSSNLLNNFRYVYQSEIVDMYFPPVKGGNRECSSPDFKIQEFGSFGYWREPLQGLEDEQLDQFQK